MTRMYGKWAGNPKGTPEVKERCKAEVADGMLFYQCQRLRKTEDGLCLQHQRLKDEGKFVNIPEEGE